DLYFVDDPGDIAIDVENGGIDEVRSSAASYVLGDWVNDLTLVGNASAGTGNAIDNRITGNAGNDTLAGGGGADSFIFNQAAGAANADSITDFASGVDKIRLDGSVMTAIGPSGNFVAGDARFFAGTAAHDADDRVIWDGTSLWY